MQETCLHEALSKPLVFPSFLDSFVNLSYTERFPCSFASCSGLHCAWSRVAVCMRSNRKFKQSMQNMSRVYGISASESKPTYSQWLAHQWTLQSHRNFLLIPQMLPGINFVHLCLSPLRWWFSAGDLRWVSLSYPSWLPVMNENCSLNVHLETVSFEFWPCWSGWNRTSSGQASALNRVLVFWSADRSKPKKTKRP